VITTSYCPDALEATELMWQSPALRVFYDLDTPVTMARLEAGENVEYLGAGLLGSYDLVLSYTGGRALAELRTRLGARRVAPLYGSVDPAEHCPAKPSAEFRCDLSYIGTYAADRQAALTALFVEPARRLPSQRFALAGAQYPPEFPWASNIFFVRHLAPSQHGAFFSSCRLTLNVTRSSMAAMGYCPSGRLFEAAACGAPLLSDAWPGLDEFFTPGEEIVLARSTDDAIAALSMGDQELQRIARAARERVLAEHTARHRAMELESLLETARLPVPA
jgi:spore maturation protein CgeB